MANLHEHMANLYEISHVCLFTYVNEPCVCLFTYVNTVALICAPTLFSVYIC